MDKDGRGLVAWAFNECESFLGDTGARLSFLHFVSVPNALSSFAA